MITEEQKDNDLAMEKGKVILSLFGGMACDQIALKELGIPIKKCYYSEVDKFAIAQTKLNFPSTIFLGNVRKVEPKQLDNIDIVFAGSPCTDLSFSGKMSGLICKSLGDYLELRNEYLKTGDESLYLVNGKFQQSILFWEFLRILKEIQSINPNVKFLLENVRMKKDQQKIINDALGLSPVAINSNLVSAQNRYRLYWTNIRTKRIGLFQDEFTDIPQPKDRGIFLKDILQPENEIDEKYYIKNPKINFEGLSIEKKSNSVRVGGQATQTQKHNWDIIKVDKKGNPKADQEKSACFTAGGNSGGNHSDMDIICVAMRGRNPDNPNDRKKGSPTKQRLEPNKEGKTNCITSVSKDNLILKKEIIQINDYHEFGSQPQQQNRVYDVNGISPCVNTDSRGHAILIQKPRGFNKGGEFTEKSPTITSNSWEQNNSLKINESYKLRRLTTTEVARLQTVPTWYIWDCFPTQQYKLLGNGWTIEVIKHILSFWDYKN